MLDKIIKKLQDFDSATLPAILRTTLLVTFAKRLPCEQQKYWRFKQVANFWIWKKFDWPKIENVRKVENGSCKMKFDAHWVQVKKGFFVFFCEKYCRNIAQCTDGRKLVVI